MDPLLGRTVVLGRRTPPAEFPPSSGLGKEAVTGADPLRMFNPGGKNLLGSTFSFSYSCPDSEDSLAIFVAFSLSNASGSRLWEVELGLVSSGKGSAARPLLGLKMVMIGTMFDEVSASGELLEEFDLLPARKRPLTAGHNSEACIEISQQTS